MTEVNQTYNCNNLLFSTIILYYIFTYNYEYIKLFISKIILYNSPVTVIILINMIGIYLFLKNIRFEINLKISYKK
jgi:hypothetical protein